MEVDTLITRFQKISVAVDEKDIASLMDRIGYQDLLDFINQVELYTNQEGAELLKRLYANEEPTKTLIN